MEQIILILLRICGRYLINFFYRNQCSLSTGSNTNYAANSTTSASAEVSSMQPVQSNGNHCPFVGVSSAPVIRRPQPVVLRQAAPTQLAQPVVPRPTGGYGGGHDSQGRDPMGGPTGGRGDMSGPDPYAT